MKIAIASGKGGTGKTTLSTNLAAYLSERHRVVLADLDVEEPNSGLFLKGDLTEKKDMFRMLPQHDPDRCTFCGQCQEVCNYSAILILGKTFMFYPELCHSCYACSELCPAQARPMAPAKMGELSRKDINGLTFLESRLEIGQEQAVPLISQTLEIVENEFDDSVWKILDSPPGTSCPVIETVKDADIVLLVTEPTPFGLHDLGLAVETVRKLDRDLAVVINKYGIGNDDVFSYCSRENIPVIARIPNDRKIAELYAGGELIYTTVPEVRSELEAIESYLLEKFPEVRQ